MHWNGGDQLRGLLDRQIQSVSKTLHQANENVSDDQIKSIESLMKLIIMHDTIKPSRKRWPAAALFGFVLLTLSVLLFCRVSQTEIELDLQVSGVSFALPKQQVMTDVTVLSALGVSGLKSIHIPRARGRPAQIIDDAPNAIRLSPDRVNDQYGTITLAALTLKEGTRVWASSSEISQQQRLSLRGDELAFRATVNGPVRMEAANGPVAQRYFDSPKSLWFYADAYGVDLDLTPPAVSDISLSPQLSVSHLSFLQVDEYMDIDRTVVRSLSTILSGTLFISALNDRKRLLRDGQILQFKESHGVIRTLKMQSGKIILKFNGKVRGMRTGTGDSQWSLMPTYLDWLRARHGLSLLWGATLYFAGIILGGLRWWGIRL